MSQETGAGPGKGWSQIPFSIHCWSSGRRGLIFLRPQCGSHPQAVALHTILHAVLTLPTLPREQLHPWRQDGRERRVADAGWHLSPGGARHALAPRWSSVPTASPSTEQGVLMVLRVPLIHGCARLTGQVATGTPFHSSPCAPSCSSGQLYRSPCTRFTCEGGCSAFWGGTPVDLTPLCLKVLVGGIILP